MPISPGTSMTVHPANHSSRDNTFKAQRLRAHYGRWLSVLLVVFLFCVGLVFCATDSPRTVLDSCIERARTSTAAALAGTGRNNQYNDSTPKQRPHSLQGACADELRSLCGEAGPQRLQCLVQLHDTSRGSSAALSPFSSQCLSWLDARNACVSATRLRPGRCRPHEGLRECLRRLPHSALPSLCVESEYYRSVKAAGRLHR